MEQDTDKLIEEQLRKLPQNLQQAISALPWKALVREVGKEHALDAEQMASLEQETMFVIYALEPPEDYVDNLVRELGIQEEAAVQVAESIAQKVFEPILSKVEELKGSNESNGKEGGVMGTIPSVPEIAPEIHPVVQADQRPTTNDQRQDIGVEKGQAPQPPSPSNSYPGGKDPYREPIE